MGATERVVFDHFDLVTTWKGLSIAQARELHFWEKTFETCLETMVEEAVADQLHNSAIAINNLEPVDFCNRVSSFIGTLGVKTFTIDLEELMNHMIAHYERELERYTWFNAGGNVRTVLKNFLRTEECFHQDIFQHPTIHVQFHTPTTPSTQGLFVDAEVLWRPPYITFDDLTTTVSEGSEFRLLPRYREPLQDRARRSFILETEYFIGPHDGWLNWDDELQWFRGILPRSLKTMQPRVDQGCDHIASLQLIAIITKQFGNGVRFERVIRLNTQFSVAPRPEHHRQMRADSGVSSWIRQDSVEIDSTPIIPDASSFEVPARLASVHPSGPRAVPQQRKRGGGSQSMSTRSRAAIDTFNGARQTLGPTFAHDNLQTLSSRTPVLVRSTRASTGTTDATQRRALSELSNMRERPGRGKQAQLQKATYESWENEENIFEDAGLTVQLRGVLPSRSRQHKSTVDRGVPQTSESGQANTHQSLPPPKMPLPPTLDQSMYPSWDLDCSGNMTGGGDSGFFHHRYDADNSSMFESDFDQNAAVHQQSNTQHHVSSNGSEVEYIEDISAFFQRPTVHRHSSHNRFEVQYIEDISKIGPPSQNLLSEAGMTPGSDRPCQIACSHSCRLREIHNSVAQDADEGLSTDETARNVALSEENSSVPGSNPVRRNHEQMQDVRACSDPPSSAPPVGIPPLPPTPSRRTCLSPTASETMMDTPLQNSAMVPSDVVLTSPADSSHHAHMYADTAIDQIRNEAVADLMQAQIRQNYEEFAAIRSRSDVRDGPSQEAAFVLSNANSDSGTDMDITDGSLEYSTEVQMGQKRPRVSSGESSSGRSVSRARQDAASGVISGMMWFGFD
ncbi:hypothetical protein B0A49_08768 [Cryomyces minteri]|uniref:Uncharacterized protein n=1 Tax=Cryomyces minteri TaxID=331657 RepID=A0A4U0WJK4_9PEZI|nr:hypothetical protein B0A49_08768 [Cryomyces minteri]